jgi:choline dehydrogenase
MLDRMEYDYIIVGAGTAGCVLANRLSASREEHVLLIEAGSDDNYLWIPVPVGYLYTIGNPRTDWCYVTEPDPGLAGRSIGYARGKVLGGCSSINAMIYMRGQASDFDHWAALGNRGWSWKDVLPVFKASEDYQHGADTWHGSGGELRVEERRVNWEILDAWRDAAEECGIAKIAEYNRGDNEGTAYFQMNQRCGVRWSAKRAFLDPALHRPNLRVEIETLVERIGFETAGGVPRANRLDVRSRQSGHYSLRARKGIILATGAIGSPHLLQRSGVGDPDLIQSLGLPLVRALPGVGENLQDHLQIRTIYKVKNTRTLNSRAGNLFGKALMALEYAALRTGPLTMPPSQLGAFARSDPGQPTANLEWHVQPLSLEKFGEPLHPFDAITPSVCNLRPSSRGHIRARSANPDEAPQIRLNYLSTDDDLATAVAGLRFTRRIMAAPALARFAPEEFKPGIDVHSEADLSAAARQLGTTIFHPVGTCRMGHDRAAVVNDRLKVHGVDGLWIIDASIMPTITSGNTNAPVVMIAEKGARFVMEDS